MWPEALSNQACSLVPDEDRLAVTVEMELEGAKRRRVAFHRSIIRSDKRLSYPEVDAIFGGRGGGAGAGGGGAGGGAGRVLALPRLYHRARQGVVVPGGGRVLGGARARGGAVGRAAG